MTNTPDEFADLVEYCWGNSSTTQGAKRIADGHPALYRLRYIELGNEQYNPTYVDQVNKLPHRGACVMYRWRYVV